MSFTALLIGDETLTSQCGEIVMARGHRIAALVTRSAELRKWGAARGLTVLEPGAALPEAEWLLSIANLHLLKPEVLARARNGAVNFHDGPLPERAGLNAPVWALLEGAARHGITWHLIEGGVDEGRILEERRFDIAPGETALTLNTRCFEAGLESFPAVVAQLETGIRPRAQGGAPHRMHLRADRPAAFGRIDFSRPAEEVERLVRALDHGRYWNPLTTAKIDTGSRVLNVGQAEAVPGSGAPGRVLSATPEGLVVACGSGAVRLERLSCQEKGLPVRPESVTTPALAPLEAGAALTAALAALAPREPALRRALAGLSPLALSGL
ncbi:formyltransferase family protein, partial [Pseudogemmobacter sonorensis]|uniref:formyltransferase family protein n=1 Tax=Pseudogemmobacter sonorensis TaxID=2989681 RepID=UPI00367C38CA